LLSHINTTIVTDRLTDQQTDHATPSVTTGRINIRSTAMLTNNNINNDDVDDDDNRRVATYKIIAHLEIWQLELKHQHNIHFYHTVIIILLSLL